MKKMIVSIIVCTKDEINNLDNCIRGILNLGGKFTTNVSFVIGV